MAATHQQLVATHVDSDPGGIRMMKTDDKNTPRARSVEAVTLAEDLGIPTRLGASR